MNEYLSLGQRNEQIAQRQKALKVAASCTPKPAIKIPSTDSAWSREKGKGICNSQVPKVTKQTQTYDLIKEGKTIPEIARKLRTSEKSVKSHIYLLKKKGKLSGI